MSVEYLHYVASYKKNVKNQHSSKDNPTSSTKENLCASSFKKQKESGAGSSQSIYKEK